MLEFAVLLHQVYSLEDASIFPDSPSGLEKIALKENLCDKSESLSKLWGQMHTQLEDLSNKSLCHLYFWSF